MSDSQQIKLDLAQTIKRKKIELLQEIESLQKQLKYSHQELFETLDLPSQIRINSLGINQNQSNIDVRTGELAALTRLYGKM